MRQSQLAAVNSVLELEVEQFGDGEEQFVDSDEDDRGQEVLEDEDDDAWEDHDDHDDQQLCDDNNDETTAKLHSNGWSPHHLGDLLAVAMQEDVGSQVFCRILYREIITDNSQLLNLMIQFEYSYHFLQ
jgi:hypothetical protein